MTQRKSVGTGLIVALAALVVLTAILLVPRAVLLFH